VRLTPENLGEVTVALRVERGQVTASLQAETPAVRDWIQSNEPELRRSLAAQGLQLDRFVVTSDGQRQRQQDDQPDKPKQGAPRGRRDTARFELDA
jgi:flagellar hook-length control protein FliK